MKRIRSLTEKRTLLTLMMCNALKECKLEYKTGEDDEDSIEFSDPITDVHGVVGFDDDKTYHLLLIDETYECPTWRTMKEFESKYMPRQSEELLIDSGTECNILLYYYDNIPITSSSSLATFKFMIMKVVTNVLRFRQVLYDLAEEG